MSAPGTSKNSHQPSTNKRVGYKRKTEAEKLQPFSWDPRRELHPANIEKLLVPKPRVEPIIAKGSAVCAGEEPTTKINDQPQSPINQIPAFNGAVGAVATAAPAAPASAFPSGHNTTEPSGDEHIDMDSEHRLAKLAREARIRNEKLKKKEMEQAKRNKSSSPPTAAAAAVANTQNGGVAKKKKQTTLQKVTKNGAGPSKTPAAKGAGRSPTLITPAPAAAGPVASGAAGPAVAKEPTAKEIAPSKPHRNPLIVRKQITKPTKPSPAAAGAGGAGPGSNPILSRGTAAGRERETPVSAVPPVPHVQAVAPSTAPSPMDIVPNTPGSLILVVMNHLSPLIPVLPPGIVAGYISFFIKLTREEEKVEHANVITAWAEHYPTALEDFIKKHQG